MDTARIQATAHGALASDVLTTEKAIPALRRLAACDVTLAVSANGRPTTPARLLERLQDTPRRLWLVVYAG